MPVSLLLRSCIVTILWSLGKTNPDWDFLQAYQMSTPSKTDPFLFVRFRLLSIFNELDTIV
jgi:hypothetical protein